MQMLWQRMTLTGFRMKALLLLLKLMMLGILVFCLVSYFS